MVEAKVGDLIRCGGRTVTIGEIITQYAPSSFTNNFWMIEGKDDSGNYFMWKQEFDGGMFIPSILNRRKYK